MDGVVGGAGYHFPIVVAASLQIIISFNSIAIFVLSGKGTNPRTAHFFFLRKNMCVFICTVFLAIVYIRALLPQLATGVCTAWAFLKERAWGIPAEGGESPTQGEIPSATRGTRHEARGTMP